MSDETLEELKKFFINGFKKFMDENKTLSESFMDDNLYVDTYNKLIRYKSSEDMINYLIDSIRESKSIREIITIYSAFSELVIKLSITYPRIIDLYSMLGGFHAE